MIKYHPSDSMLHQFVQGTLPISMSVAISTHQEMCAECRAKLTALQKMEAVMTFESVEESEHIASWSEENNDAMIDAITSLPDEAEKPAPSNNATLNFNDVEVVLPHALRRIGHGRFTRLGKLTRTRLDLEDGDLRTSLLHIEPGGEIPLHTHKGFEITLLLQGEFSDENGHYGPGDFIWTDSRHNHTPYSENGCVCLTVVSDALHFNAGLSQLLNPIGKLIY